MRTLMNTRIKCAQCKNDIPYGEPFVKAGDYHYHLQCAGLLLEVFQKAADNNGGDILVGGEAVEHLRCYNYRVEVKDEKDN